MLDLTGFSGKSLGMRILIAPDKFKGSLSGKQAAEAIERGFSKVFPQANYIQLPLADGGEGILDAFRDVGATEIRETLVNDALDREVAASWLLMLDGTTTTALIESSQANGLWRISEFERNLPRSSSFGVGQLIREAISAGAKKIIIGIGGSATNDAGLGIAAALGCRFLDASGHPVEPIPENFLMISSIDSENLPHLPPIIVACDVANPLLGPRGATRIYGPQKGLAPTDTEATEAGHHHFATIANAHFKTDFSEVPGAGAAGGLGYGLMTFCGATLESGFDCIADALEAEKHVSTADIVITAEGSLDSQSLEGKTPIGVSRLARKHGVPVYALAGRLADEELLHLHFDGIASIVNAPMTLDHAIANGSELLELAAERLARILKTSNHS